MTSDWVDANTRLSNSKMPGMSSPQTNRPIIAGCCLAIWLLSVSYAVITPPFQVPDEVAHYWHSASLAHGHVWQVKRNGRQGSYVPRSARDFVYLTWVETAGHPAAKVGVTRRRAAAQLPFEPEPVFRPFPALYTPVPYLPAALSCLVTDLLHVRALPAFYAGRVVTATASVILIAAAMLECGELMAIIAALASLPMALFLFGSYSADALTIGLALYTGAVAWRLRTDDDVGTGRWTKLCLAACLLAMCKVIYAPIALLAIRPRVVFGAQRKWRQVVLLLGSVALGAALSSIVLARQYYPLRADADPKAQIHEFEAHPFRVMSVVVRDYVARLDDYRQQFVGSLGWIDVPLPGILTSVAFCLLLAVAATSDVSITPAGRAFAALLAILLCLGVSLSQYIVWTPPGKAYVDGIQGRYFLPVALVLLLPMAAAVRSKGLALTARALYALTAIVINVEALVILAKRYY
jgi:uncharacterized membrane protein